jgi:2-polyprenyl-3-methyl-5-hydroxy-6-metoxy-1,4-benzoquinol methylase
MYLIWNRLKYVLSPQFDIYEVLSRQVRDKVADIGFGTGFGMHLFSVNAKEVYGFDIDKGAIQFAQKVFPMKNLHFQYGDISEGIPAGDFDFITMIDVIEHIPDDCAALENVKKMLAPGGTFVCSTPNRLSRYRKSENHQREYSPAEFKFLLRQVFDTVALRNYVLDPLASKYDNPILAACQ